MVEQSYENKIIYKTVCGVFGGNPQLFRYYDKNNENHIDIVSSVDCPQTGASSYSTLALSDTLLSLDGTDLGLKLELLGVCESSLEVFPRILSTAAFCIMKTGWSCYPGMVYPDILSIYDCSKTMRHLMFIEPSIWGDQLITLELSSKTVAWLMAVPISESEYLFWMENGPGPLETLLEEEEINLLNINRRSAI